MRIRFQYNSVVFLLVLLGLVVFCASVQAGEIYKWVDEEGNVHYSQDPQHRSAQPMNIKVPKSSASTETASNREDAATAVKSQPSDADQTEEQAQKEAAARKQQEAEKKNCQIAMKRLATITAGGRIYEVDEQGERIYWDDNTRKAKLADAQKDVDEWCGQE
jgi:hypothetical protein